MTRTRFPSAVVAVAISLGCRAARPPDASVAPPGAIPPAARTVVDRMDRSADPCADFHRYACGGSPPGAGEPLAEEVHATLRTILEEAAARPGDDPASRRLGDFYAACMDESGIEATGIEPLRALLTKIGRVNDPFTFMRLVGELHGIGVESLFRVTVGPRGDDPLRATVRFTAGGLGLPDPAAYRGDDPRGRALLDPYRRHAARLFELSGQPRALAEESSAAAIEFESELAAIHLASAEAADGPPGEVDMGVAELEGLDPPLPWGMYLRGAGLPDGTRVAVDRPALLAGIAAKIRSTRQRPLEAYLRLRLLQRVAPLLGADFVEEEFGFVGRRVEGRSAMPPRWSRCVDETRFALGDELGRRFVARSVPEANRVAARETIAAVVEALRGRLADRGTSGATRLAALEVDLADAGGPAGDSQLRVERGTHLVNVLEARQLAFARDVAAAARGEWVERQVEATSNRGRYDRAAHRLVFSAAAFALPRFGPAVPAALRYGGFGAIVARELLGALDLPADWTASVAHRAFRAAERGRGAGGPSVPGLSEERLFFVALAQSLCSGSAEGEPTSVTPAPAARARIDEAIAVTPELGGAFRCPPGSATRPARSR